MSQGTASATPDPEDAQKPVVTAIGPAKPPAEDAVKIGLWGPPQSGKTTFLASLPIAVNERSARNGLWQVYPHDLRSWELLERFEKALVEDQRFPESTPVNARVPLEWLFVGDLTGSTFDKRKRRWRRWRRQRERLESRFVLDLIDVQGDAYRRDPGQGQLSETASNALDHLSEAQGIIYLFDPIGEKDNRNSAAYVRGSLNELLLRATQNGGRPGLYLPHQLSVCITKFDHPEMFRQARRMHLVHYDDDGMPRVRDEDAEQFFEELCTGRFWSEHDYEAGQQSAAYVRDKIRRVFDPDRIRYFVTSSIGFWMEPPGEGRERAWFNPDDPVNYHDKHGKPAIRGQVRPVNALEPLISLQQRIARG